MTNTKLFLLLGTSLSFLPQISNAAECAVTDCSLLGYTDSPCPGSGLKCPFGDGWYCGGGAAEDCIKLGYNKDCTGAGESGVGQTCNGKYQSCSCDSSYKYTCLGTGYAGGSGSACGGKYKACNCSAPYTWTSGVCQCPSIYQYTCSGTGYAGGSGSACGGKYSSCKCASNYTWNGSRCKYSCSSSYKYTCSGTGYAGGSGTACGGKYTSCNCSSGYVWKNEKCVEPTCLKQEYIEESLNLIFKTCVLEDNVYKPVCEHIGKCYVSEIATQLKYNSYEECIRQRDCYTGAISGIGCKICTQYDI